MPTEGDTKPCTRTGCDGTMTYSANAKAPGSQIGAGLDDGKIVWESRPQSGWLCDRDPDHFDRA
jgi:hypothetical protein